MMEEYLARVEQQYREEVLYPKIGREQMLLRELERESQLHGGMRRRQSVRWIGRGLLHAGDLLTSVGERLALPPGGLTTSDR